LQFNKQLVMREDVANFVEDLSKREFIVFAGTGVVGETGIPSWLELLQELDRAIPLYGKDLLNMGVDNYPRVAQEYYNLLVKKGREKEYAEVIKSKINASNAPCSYHQLEILQCTGKIVTTNFDDTFETAYRKMSRFSEKNKIPDVQSLPDFREDILLKKYSVTYLHGRVHDNYVIFKTDDYDLFYPSVSGRSDGSHVIEDFLRYLYKNHVMVFIGFSFGDRYFRECLKNINDAIRKEDVIHGRLMSGFRARVDRIRHYALLADTTDEEEYTASDFGMRPVKGDKWMEEKQLIKEKKAYEEKILEKFLSSINVTVLRYKKHKDWTEWFEEIDRVRKAQVTAKG